MLIKKALAGSAENPRPAPWRLIYLPAFSEVIIKRFCRKRCDEDHKEGRFFQNGVFMRIYFLSRTSISPSRVRRLRRRLTVSRETEAKLAISLWVSFRST